jgi:hypothetical protein
MQNWFLIFLIFLSGYAYGADLKESSVIVEVSKESEDKCGVSEKSIQSQVETVIRQNNIKVIPLLDGPVFYVMLSATPGPQGGSCYGHGYLQVFSSETLRPKWAKKPIPGIYEYCLRTFNFIGPKGYEQQTSINNAIADIARQCISKILK